MQGLLGEPPLVQPTEETPMGSEIWYALPYATWRAYPTSGDGSFAVVNRGSMGRRLLQQTDDRVATRGPCNSARDPCTCSKFGDSCGWSTRVQRCLPGSDTDCDECPFMRKCTLGINNRWSSSSPSQSPTIPTSAPTTSPSSSPTVSPSIPPTATPTASPTAAPTPIPRRAGWLEGIIFKRTLFGDYVQLRKISNDSQCLTLRVVLVLPDAHACY